MGREGGKGGREGGTAVSRGAHGCSVLHQCHVSGRVRRGRGGGESEVREGKGGVGEGLGVGEGGAYEL